jgi:HAD superfamily hydrolase (TIGR01662 family)
MRQKIDAIILDTGNTMTTVAPDPDLQKHSIMEIARLLGVRESSETFKARLSEHYDAYKMSVKQTMVEPSETELWTRWMVPDLPSEKVVPLAGQLTRLWLTRKGRRTLRPDVKATLAELSKRGYVLAILANALSPTEIPDWLEQEGLKKYFKAVVLSSTFGRRKPDPYIFLEAARQAGVEPGKCAYVGDNPSRDIQGARAAGFGSVIILLEAATLSREPNKGRERPDGLIRECRDLLNIFPPR